MCKEGNQLTFLRFCTGIKIIAWISDVMWQVGKNIGKREQTNIHTERQHGNTSKTFSRPQCTQKLLQGSAHHVNNI